MKTTTYILCIEDEPEVLDAVVKDISSFEDLFPIETARSTEEARTVIAKIQEAKDRIGIVLCDHIMPGENGVEFLIELYRDPYTARTKKILLTGQAGLDATVRAVNHARLDFFIGKPWKKNELVASLKEKLTDYILEHEYDLLPYAALIGEEKLAEAMCSRMPGNR